MQMVIQQEEWFIFFIEQCQHEVVTQAVVCDLLVQDDICYGVQYFISETSAKVVYAHNNNNCKVVVLGSIYRYHTNSTANAGEVQGIIAEKHLPLKDMEMMHFIQLF